MLGSAQLLVYMNRGKENDSRIGCREYGETRMTVWFKY